jgi:hypothetical protein
VLLVTDEDAVPVFELVTVDVVVKDRCGVAVIFVVFEKDGELELVRDGLDDIVKEEHAVAVLEGWPVLELLGHVELVLDEVIDEVVVLV